MKGNPMLQEVFDKYSTRFLEAAKGSPSELVIVEHDGIRDLFPSRAHAAWFRMGLAKSVEEADAIAREFLDS